MLTFADFDYAIENLNHLDMTAPRPVRAIAAQCTSQRAAMFLAVASNDLKMVFDDIDSWFVHMCAVSDARLVLGDFADTLRPVDNTMSILARPRTPGGAQRKGNVPSRHYASASNSYTWHSWLCRTSY